jgi:hypothetical protein
MPSVYEDTGVRVQLSPFYRDFIFFANIFTGLAFIFLPFLNKYPLPFFNFPCFAPMLFRFSAVNRRTAPEKIVEHPAPFCQTPSRAEGGPQSADFFRREAARASAPAACRLAGLI